MLLSQLGCAAVDSARFDALAWNRFRACLGQICVGVPLSLLDRGDHLVGNDHCTSCCCSADRWGRTGLDADHKVVELIQDCVTLVQFDRFATQSLREQLVCVAEWVIGCLLYTSDAADE